MVKLQLVDPGQDSYHRGQWTPRHFHPFEPDLLPPSTFPLSIDFSSIS